MLNEQKGLKRPDVYKIVCLDGNIEKKGRQQYKWRKMKKK